MSDLSKYRIAKQITLDDGSGIVLFDMLGVSESVPQDTIENNIYRLSPQGRVVWRISAQAPIYPRSPFTGVGYDDRKQLVAYRWDGDQYQIDLNTGVARPLRLGR